MQPTAKLQLFQQNLFYYISWVTELWCYQNLDITCILSNQWVDPLKYMMHANMICHVSWSRSKYVASVVYNSLRINMVVQWIHVRGFALHLLSEMYISGSLSIVMHNSKPSIFWVHRVIDLNHFTYGNSFEDQWAVNFPHVSKLLQHLDQISL